MDGAFQTYLEPVVIKHEIRATTVVKITITTILTVAAVNATAKVLYPKLEKVHDKLEKKRNGEVWKEATDDS